MGRKTDLWSDEMKQFDYRLFDYGLVGLLPIESDILIFDNDAATLAAEDGDSLFDKPGISFEPTGGLAAYTANPMNAALLKETMPAWIEGSGTEVQPESIFGLETGLIEDDDPESSALGLLYDIFADDSLSEYHATEALGSTAPEMPGPAALSSPPWAFASRLPEDLFLDARGGKKGPPDSDPTEPPADGGTSTTLTATYTSGLPDAFNIDIQFYGDLWTDNLYSSFIASADFLSSIIVGDLPDDYYFGSYYSDQPTLRYADDIVIEAYLTDIDGTGGVLGQAGPTYARDTNQDGIIDGLPVAGIMEFDISDAANLASTNLWDDTVFHEMMHTLGFGTLWDFEAWSLVGDQAILIDDAGTKRPVDDIVGYEYMGDANGLYDGETNFIPVEAGGGSGTARGHWDEAVLDNEIMTGYINPTNYLSDFSVAALEDLGYTLDANWANIAATQSAGIALDATTTDLIYV